MAFKCDIPARPTVQQDDEAVRITRWDFEPGAVTGWHRHAWPYFVIMLVEGTLRVHDGTKVTDVGLEAGQSYRRTPACWSRWASAASPPIERGS